MFCNKNYWSDKYQAMDSNAGKDGNADKCFLSLKEKDFKKAKTCSFLSKPSYSKFIFEIY